MQGIDGLGWTEERTEVLKKAWVDGLSASQIAKQLGGVSRNAVIGKVHRLGLAGRATPSSPRVAHRTTFKPPKAKPAPVNQQAMMARIAEQATRSVPAEPPEDLQPLPLAEHHRCWCRWPIGDPRSEAFGYCGREQRLLPNGRRHSYCPEHLNAEARRSFEANERARRGTKSLGKFVSSRLSDSSVAVAVAEDTTAELAF